MRVPLIVFWPGKTRTGQVESDPVITMDLYPTILEMTGIRPLSSVVDGMSLVGLLRSGAKVERDALFWHYPHYHPVGQRLTVQFGAGIIGWCIFMKMAMTSCIG